MTHIRTDESDLNKDAVMACGLKGPDMPEGDVYWFAAEWRSERADCPKCREAMEMGEARPRGIPLSQVTPEMLDRMQAQHYSEDEISGAIDAAGNEISDADPGL